MILLLYSGYRWPRIGGHRFIGMRTQHQKLTRKCDIRGNIFMWAFKGVMDQNPSPFGHILLDQSFSPSCIMHPDTYLNKVIMSFFLFQRLIDIVGFNFQLRMNRAIGFTGAAIVLIGSEQGPMQLWNISTKKKIFEFKGWDSPITCCVFSPDIAIIVEP
ncbi:hypothetical protein AHAS_Ahas01G0154900 [Arachis hypogaea]